MINTMGKQTKTDKYNGNLKAFIKSYFLHVDVKFIFHITLSLQLFHLKFPLNFHQPEQGCMPKQRRNYVNKKEMEMAGGWGI